MHTLKKNNSMLNEIIACPTCKNAYTQNESQALTCQTCEIEYSVEKNIPILIDEKLIDFSIPSNEPSVIQKRYEIELFKNLYSNSDNAKAYNASIGCEKTHRSPFDIKYDQRTRDFFSRIAKNSRILNIGGLSNYELKQLGHEKNLVNLDISKNIIHSRNGDMIHNLVIGDVEELPFLDQSFDTIIVQYVVHHLFDQKKAFNELKRVLKKGGSLFIIEPASFSLASVYYFIKRVIVTIFGEKKLRQMIGYHGSQYESYMNVGLFKKELSSSNFQLKIEKSTLFRVPFIGKAVFLEKFLNITQLLENTFLTQLFGSYVFVEAKKL